MTAMRVLLNAVSIKGGGSAVVLLRLLEAMVAQNPEVNWWVIAHPTLIERLPRAPSVRALSFPWAEYTPAHLLYWYNFTLPDVVKRVRADVLFSQTNYLPVRSVACPTLLLEQHAGHFSDAFCSLMEQSLGRWPSRAAWRGKTRWVHRSVRSANLVTVQTRALAEAVSAQAGVPSERIRVIPHGPGLILPAAAPRQWPAKSVWRIGYVSKPGVQKNFGVLLRAIQRLRETGRAARLVLTLDVDDPQARIVSAMAEAMGLVDCIENHGDVAQSDIRAVYDQIDAFVFPSLCESFGFPMVEAMAAGLPLFIADTPANCEVAGFAGSPFGEDDAETLSRGLSRLMDDRKFYEERAAASLARSRQYSWEASGKGALAALQELGRCPQ